MPIDPGGEPRDLLRPGEQQEALRPQSGDRRQCLDPAARIQHRRRDDIADGEIDDRARELAQQRLGLGAFQPQLGIAGAVEESDARLRRRDLAGDMIIAVAGLLAGRLEPDRPLPADHGDEFRAGRRQPGMDRRAADHPRLIEIQRRRGAAAHMAHHLAGAVAGIGRHALAVGEAAVLQARGVEAGPALHDPFGGELAGGGGERDAAGIHAGGEEAAAHRRRLAQQHLHIRGEALGPVEQGADLGLVQDREALQRHGHIGLDLVPIAVEQAEGEIPRQLGRGDGNGIAVEEADQEAAHILAAIHPLVIGEEQRHVAGHDVERLGQDVEMLDGMQRHLDADHPPQHRRPQPRRDDHVLALDLARRRHDRGDAPALDRHAGHRRVLEDAGPAQLGTAGEGHGEIGRVDAPVAGNPDSADDALLADDGQLLHHLLRVQIFDLEPPGASQGRQAAIDRQALGLGGEHDPAGLAPAQGLAGLRLQLGIEIDGVADHLADQGIGAIGLHIAGGMPARAAADLGALQQHHIAATERRQVIGDAGPHHPGADDDDLSMTRNCLGHGAWVLPRKARRVDNGSHGP